MQNTGLKHVVLPKVSKPLVFTSRQLQNLSISGSCRQSNMPTQPTVKAERINTFHFSRVSIRNNPEAKLPMHNTIRKDKMKYLNRIHIESNFKCKFLKKGAKADCLANRSDIINFAAITLLIYDNDRTIKRDGRTQVGVEEVSLTRKGRR